MRTNFFCTNFLNTPRGPGHPGKIPGTSQIPLFETQGRQTFEREHELFGHRPFAWKTPTLPGGLQTQKVNLCALFSCLILGRSTHVVAHLPGKCRRRLRRWCWAPEACLVMIAGQWTHVNKQEGSAFGRACSNFIAQKGTFVGRITPPREKITKIIRPEYSYVILGGGYGKIT